MAKVARLNITRPVEQGDLNPVGMIVQSMLTEAQFQVLNGTNWILADGRSVAGSAYATVTGNANVPDARGLFLRAAGTRGSAIGGITYAGGSVGDANGDTIQGHKHNDSGHQHSQTGSQSWNAPGGLDAGNVNGTAVNLSNTNDGYANLGDPTTTTYGTPRIGSETRPANLAVNIFIKIN